MKEQETKTTDNQVKVVEPDEEMDLEWLRNYKMHQENLLYSRINIFLLSLSLIAAAFLAVTTASGTPKLLSFALKLLGVALSVLWYLAALRQKQVLDHYADQQHEYDRSYQKARFSTSHDGGIPGQRIIVHGLPISFILFWLAALFFF